MSTQPGYLVLLASKPRRDREMSKLHNMDSLRMREMTMIIHATHMMELMVSRSCMVVVTPHVPDTPPASCVSAGEPTSSDDSASVAAMVVLPTEVTALAAV